MADSDFYPSTARMWRALDALGGSKPVAYLPDELRREFEAYVADLAMHPMVWDTEFKRMRQGGTDSRESQVRRQKMSRAPKERDFATLWLGMSWDWWRTLPEHPTMGEAYGLVQEAVRAYCRAAMMDGAMVGVYNASVVSRYLGLSERVEVVKGEERSEADVDAEIARWRAVAEGEEVECAASVKGASQDEG